MKCDTLAGGYGFANDVAQAGDVGDVEIAGGELWLVLSLHIQKYAINVASAHLVRSTTWWRCKRHTMR